MFEFLLNGTTIQETAPLTVSQLLEKQGFRSGEVAVAIDCQFIPRSKYDETLIQEAQQVEVVQPMQGG